MLHPGVSVFDAAKTLCQEAGWKLTPLHIQKLLYIMQMVYWGGRKKHLINTEFVIQDYGPNCLELQKRLSRWGGHIVPKEEFFEDNLLPEDSEHRDVIRVVYKDFQEYPASALVATVHLPGTAWSRKYPKEGCNVVTSYDMEEEYITNYTYARDG